MAKALNLNAETKPQIPAAKALLMVLDFAIDQREMFNVRCSSIDHEMITKIHPTENRDFVDALCSSECSGGKPQRGRRVV
jgi:hypothetical protein